MKWTDIQDIAIALAEIHPDTDPKTVRFTDLYRWVMALAGCRRFQVFQRGSADPSAHRARCSFFSAPLLQRRHTHPRTGLRPIYSCNSPPRSHLRKYG